MTNPVPLQPEPEPSVTMAGAALLLHFVAAKVARAPPRLPPFALQHHGHDLLPTSSNRASGFLASLQYLLVPPSRSQLSSGYAAAPLWFALVAFHIHDPRYYTTQYLIHISSFTWDYILLFLWFYIKKWNWLVSCQLFVTNLDTHCDLDNLHIIGIDDALLVYYMFL
jgi:hypothetical protein